MEKQKRPEVSLKVPIQQMEGNHLEGYDNELTPAEVDQILKKARTQKIAKIKEAEYWNKVRSSVKQGPKFGPEQLKAYIKIAHPAFVVDNYNMAIFDALVLYFTGDKRFENCSPNFSLSKGIMLYGAIGCGKTEMMRVFSKNTFRPFAVNPVRKITDAYTEKNGGVQALKQYSSMLEVYPHQNLGHKLCGRCFDDLGTEENRKNFGNEINVMQDILYKIYDEQLTGHFHVTTNLTTDEIESYYGKRIRSRMREMFNVLEFPKDAPDRRV